jgi:hypothetical protein
MGSGHRKGWKKEQIDKLARLVESTIRRRSAAESGQLPKAQQIALDTKKSQRINEMFNLVGYSLGLGAWGWTVLAPESSVVFGSVLLAVAATFGLIGIVRGMALRKTLWIPLAVVVVGGIGYFDWTVVISPQRGKEFKSLLAEGYHLTDDCGTRSAKDPLPVWLRDKSTAWQAQVQQLVTERLDSQYLQLWRGSTIVGLVSDSNLTAYQCTLLSVKVQALETIIAEKYDPKLAHQKYEGPLYWLESVDGKVDISEALKNGGARFTIHERGSVGAVQVTGQIPKE